jgi:hypothetical protein
MRTTLLALAPSMLNAATLVPYSALADAVTVREPPVIFAAFTFIEVDVDHTVAP